MLTCRTLTQQLKLKIGFWREGGREGGCCAASGAKMRKIVLLDIQNKYGLDFKGPVRPQISVIFI